MFDNRVQRKQKCKLQKLQQATEPSKRNLQRLEEELEGESGDHYEPTAPKEASWFKPQLPLPEG